MKLHWLLKLVTVGSNKVADAALSFISKTFRRKRQIARTLLVVWNIRLGSDKDVHF
jgi:hypothetical protein